MLLSVVVPAHNEEKLLPSFIREVTSYLEKKAPEYELLVIENGSKDKTLQIGKEFSSKNKKIKAFHLAKPAYGAAYIYGVRKARGDYVVVFNVDYWDKKFIDLVNVDLLGYQVVSGSKNLPSSRDKRPLSRRLLSKAFVLFLKFLLGFQGSDTHGIKGLNRRKIMPIVKECKIKSGIFDTEFLIRCQRAGLKILEQPVEVSEKRPSRFGIKRILYTPKDIMELYLALKE